MRPSTPVFALLAVVAVGCGGGDASSDVDEPSGAGAVTSGDAADGDVGGDDDDAAAASGSSSADPAAMNTIRVGGEVWQRTLPMTTGQCFVQNVEGLPPSGNAWGTLEGDDDLRFSAKQLQDGETEAEVETADAYWIAGYRVADGPDDLVVELDFDTLVITGEGTFTNVFTGETAPGSFAFQCEDDGSGG